ncbi:PLC-like phosphodiesterase, TIM beta/alpha-barrel domain [Pseudocohnilembus persalinus]|uniref:PLC-like phosphodiesterase, TIM beta/alpha-barrel domain n=1 Tax=Pseudocohnilembus persalinus TaxID=266149 RepID=A0A0V0QYN2_PSEPJ|nr:PLC-like phosphodiesterase, TIM beta/alpha-barrel domain [Pseudocohnilembus persalinus]|eukprot:KRX07178.1 PLC-like phosphodiesterase, TIM beta/alpha-barrel domain [Pseudocohnilembus persalinus]
MVGMAQYYEELVRQLESKNSEIEKLNSENMLMKIYQDIQIQQQQQNDSQNKNGENDKMIQFQEQVKGIISNLTKQIEELKMSNLEMGEENELLKNSLQEVEEQFEIQKNQLKEQKKVDQQLEILQKQVQETNIKQNKSQKEGGEISMLRELVEKKNFTEISFRQKIEELNYENEILQNKNDQLFQENLNLQAQIQDNICFISTKAEQDNLIEKKMITLENCLKGFIESVEDNDQQYQMSENFNKDLKKLIKNFGNKIEEGNQEKECKKKDENQIDNQNQLDNNQQYFDDYEQINVEYSLQNYNLWFKALFKQIRNNIQGNQVSQVNQNNDISCATYSCQHGDERIEEESNLLKKQYENQIKEKNRQIEKYLQNQEQLQDQIQQLEKKIVEIVKKEKNQDEQGVQEQFDKIIENCENLGQSLVERQFLQQEVNEKEIEYKKLLEAQSLSAKDIINLRKNVDQLKNTLKNCNCYYNRLIQNQESLEEILVKQLKNYSEKIYGDVEQSLLKEFQELQEKYDKLKNIFNGPEQEEQQLQQYQSQIENTSNINNQVSEEIFSPECGGLFLGYAGCSLLFLKKPQFLWTKYISDNYSMKQLMHQCIQSQKNKDIKNRIMVIAHRGGSFEKPENTMQAFQNAVEKGVDMIETDIMMTKDKKIITFHDEDLIRLCGKKQTTNDSFYNEMVFQEKYNLDFKKGGKYEIISGEKIQPALLEELFQKFPNTLINMEIKDPSEQLILEVRKMIEKYDREENTIWGVKSWDWQKELDFRSSIIPQFTNANDTAKLLIHYLTGFLPFSKPRGQVICVPVYTNDYYQWQTDRFIQQMDNKAEFLKIKIQNRERKIVEMKDMQNGQKDKLYIGKISKFNFENSKACENRILSRKEQNLDREEAQKQIDIEKIGIKQKIYENFMLNKQLRDFGVKAFSSLMFSYIKLSDKCMKGISQHMQKRGYFIFAWVLNDEQSYQKAIDMGVNGIMTDKPSELINYLKERDLLFRAKVQEQQ